MRILNYNERKRRLREKRNVIVDGMLDVVNYHFRDMDNDAKYSPHYWAYDEEKIIAMMKRIGFSDAHKWEIDERLVNPKRINRTIYVVGIK